MTAGRPISLAQGFVDGGHLRAVAQLFGLPPLNPRRVIDALLYTAASDDWPHGWPALARTGYYDAAGIDGGASSPAESLATYWDAVEKLNDTELRFGWYRARARRAPEVDVGQKAVDVQLAVDLVVGAFSGLFDIAVVFTGDADFVPAVEEAKRRGVIVVVGSVAGKLSPQLRSAADRAFELTKDAFEQSCLLDQTRTHQ